MAHRIYLDAALYKCKNCDHTEEFYSNDHFLEKIDSDFQTRHLFFWDDVKNDFSQAVTSIKNRTPPYRELYDDEELAWTEMVVKCKNCNNGEMEFVDSIKGKHKAEFEKMESEKAYKKASQPYDVPKNCNFDVLGEDGFISLGRDGVEKDIVIIVLYPKEAEIYRIEQAERDKEIPF